MSYQRLQQQLDLNSTQAHADYASGVSDQKQYQQPKSEQTNCGKNYR